MIVDDGENNVLKVFEPEPEPLTVNVDKLLVDTVEVLDKDAALDAELVLVGVLELTAEPEVDGDALAEREKDEADTLGDNVNKEDGVVAGE